MSAEIDVLPYAGEFPLAFLNAGETVCSAGRDTHAAIITTVDGETCRFEEGEWVIRWTDGRLYAVKPFIYDLDADA